MYVGSGIRTLSFLPIFPRIFAIFAIFRLTLDLFHFIQFELSMYSVTTNYSLQCLVLFNAVCFGMIQLPCCFDSTLMLFNVIEV